MSEELKVESLHADCMEYRRMVQREIAELKRSDDQLRQLLREMAERWIEDARNNGNGHKEKCACELLEAIKRAALS
jgi:hypothetical protein